MNRVPGSAGFGSGGRAGASLNPARTSVAHTATANPAITS